MVLRVGKTPGRQGIDDSVEEVETLLIRLRRTLSERIRSTNWLPQSLKAPKQPLRQSTTGLSTCSAALFVGSTPSRSANAQSAGQSFKRSRQNPSL
jgi:hypothetical protein